MNTKIISPLLVLNLVLITNISQANQCGKVFKKVEPNRNEEMALKLSKETEENIKSKNPKLFAELPARIKESSPQNSPTTLNFKKGELVKEGTDLVWKTKNGKSVILVKADDHPGETIGVHLISPDGEKIAYSATTGNDVNNWHIKTISENPVKLNTEPIVVRMDGFTWDAHGKKVYYSHWNPKESFTSKKKPMIEQKEFDIATGKSRTVFNHKKAENFALFDVGDGQTLIAHRLLSPETGVRAFVSAFVGRKNGNDYVWTELMPSNRYVGHFVGVRQTPEGPQAVFQSSHQNSNNFKVVGINIANPKNIETLIPSNPERLLLTTQMFEGVLVAMHTNPKNRDFVSTFYDFNTMEKVDAFDPKKNDLVPYGQLDWFKVGPGGKKAVSSYRDAKDFDTVMIFDLATRKLTKQPQLKKNGFDLAKVKVETKTFKSFDGVEVPIQIFTPKNADGSIKKPKFVFVRSYGSIGVADRVEAPEMQRVLEMGGAYVHVSVRGGGEKGLNWFLSGARDKFLTAKDIAAASDYVMNEHTAFREFNLKYSDIVSMGRSYGGLSNLLLASFASNKFGMIFSVVPPADMVTFYNSWFGRIAHSDFAPAVDAKGNLVIDEKFWSYMKKISPNELKGQIAKNMVAETYIISGENDGRIDQRTETHQLALDLNASAPKGLFHYYEMPGGSHGTRAYMDLIMTAIANKYGISKLEPIPAENQ